VKVKQTTAASVRVQQCPANHKALFANMYARCSTEYTKFNH